MSSPARRLFSMSLGSQLLQMAGRVLAAAWRHRPRPGRRPGPFALLPARTMCLQLVNSAPMAGGPGGPRQPGQDALTRRRIQAALADAAIRTRFRCDLQHTLSRLGVPAGQNAAAADFVIATLGGSDDLDHARQEIIAMLEFHPGVAARTAHCATAPQEQYASDFRRTLLLHKQQHEQAVFDQLCPYTDGLQGACLLDFGAGDGLLDDLLARHVHADIVPVDLQFHQLGVTAAQTGPCHAVCSGDAARPFDAALAINVLAHDRRRQQSLLTLCRMLRPNGRLFVVETIPIGMDRQTLAESLECSFLNDYLLRAVLHGMMPLPVSGMYEKSVEDWESRFRDAGFEIAHWCHLGRSNDINPNWNVLFVLNKPALRA